MKEDQEQLGKNMGNAHLGNGFSVLMVRCSCCPGRSRVGGRRCWSWLRCCWRRRQCWCHLLDTRRVRLVTTLWCVVKLSEWCWTVVVATERCPVRRLVKYSSRARSSSKQNTHAGVPKVASEPISKFAQFKKTIILQCTQKLHNQLSPSNYIKQQLTLLLIMKGLDPI